MHKKVSGIYRIRNLLDNKVYIGLSSNINQRFIQHKTDSKSMINDKPLHNAIRKYGIENFEFSIIEYCDISKLSDKEKFWIEFYNSTDRDCGYNLHGGGQSNIEVSSETREKLRNAQQNKIPIVKLNRFGSFIERYESVNHASKSNDFNYPSDIYKMAIKKIKCKYIKNYIYVTEDDYISGDYLIDKTDWVVQFDLDSNYITHYYNMSDASMNTGVKSSCISNACNKIVKTGGGFLWCRYNEFENGYYPITNDKERKKSYISTGNYHVSIINMQTNEIFKFKQIKDIIEFLGVSKWYISHHLKDNIIINNYKVELKIGERI